MGLFNWPLQISNLNGDKSSEIEAMVGTGAIFTMLPGSLLREIGISPTRKDIFELADGSRAEMKIGEMRVRSNGYSAVTPVIFGSEDATTVDGSRHPGRASASSGPRRARDWFPGTWPGTDTRADRAP